MNILMIILMGIMMMTLVLVLVYVTELSLDRVAQNNKHKLKSWKKYNRQGKR